MRGPALGNVPRCGEEIALFRPDPHSAVVGLAVLVRGSGQITQDVGAGEVKIHFLLPGRLERSHPMRLV